MDYRIYQELNGNLYQLLFTIESYTPIQGEKGTEYKDVLTTLKTAFLNGDRVSLRDLDDELCSYKPKEQKAILACWEAEAVKVLEKVLAKK